MGLLKYPGGKDSELHVIREHMPAEFSRYYEPFVGGGAVFLDTEAEEYLINDFSKDLINLYRCVKDRDKDFYSIMDCVNTAWKSLDRYIDDEEENSEQKKSLFYIYNTYKDNRDDDAADSDLTDALEERIQDPREKKRLENLLSVLDVGDTQMFVDIFYSTVSRKFKRMKFLEYNKRHLPQNEIRDNITCCLKGAFYMYMRHLYNHSRYRTNGFKAFAYLFMRDMCYSGMFRFNDSGEFNVPYGGISYNSKTYDNTKAKYLNESLIGKLAKTTICAEDYMKFLKLNPPRPNDFMFVDPPYDSEFSTYDQNSFDKDAQIKLSNYLIHECECKFMLDIKSTEFISSLYKDGTICRNGNKLRVIPFDKKYAVSFMNRNSRDVTHILVMNYGAESEASSCRKNVQEQLELK